RAGLIAQSYQAFSSQPAAATDAWVSDNHVNCCFSDKPAEKKQRCDSGRRIVSLATVPSARSATPKMPTTRAARPPRLERARRGISEPKVKSELCSRTSVRVRFLLRRWERS